MRANWICSFADPVITMTLTDLARFAKRYAEAWCSKNPDNVAAFYAEGGSLSVNDGPPAIGGAAIAAEARGFMTTFPEIVVTMDRVTRDSDGAKFHWTLTGTNTCPGGTGNAFASAGTNFGRSTTTD
jgi:SnoaL-like protein